MRIGGLRRRHPGPDVSRPAPQLIGPGLVLLVAVVYGRAAGHDFITYDDGTYVYGNARVLDGVTPSGVLWAFTTEHGGNWHPLTWLSHMLDVSLFGLTPGAHHLVSVALHGLATLVLFGVLRRLTGAPWRSGVVAALFAVHPLHVESVAWIAERKDVLAGLFFVSTIAAWARFIARPSVGGYLLAVGCFALGLLAKPMVVTLPFVLLLLDWWPFGRLAEGRQGEMGRRVRRAIVEKAPFFLLAAVVSVITYHVQVEARSLLADLPAGTRAANALVAYATYLVKTVAPVGLSIYYPHPAALGRPVPLAAVLGATALLLAISALVIAARRRRPYLLVGWLWYLGTLVPVIGLVPVGWHAMADRYTYLPLVGIFIAVVWGVGDAIRPLDPRGVAVTAAATVLLATHATVAWVQVGHWRHTGTLYAHAVTVTPDSMVAWNNLGSYLTSLGRPRAAITAFDAALRIKPDYALAWFNRGVAHAQLGNEREALESHARAVALNPGFATRAGLGIASRRWIVPADAPPPRGAP